MATFLGSGDSNITNSGLVANQTRPAGHYPTIQEKTVLKATQCSKGRAVFALKCKCLQWGKASHTGPHSRLRCCRSADNNKWYKLPVQRDMITARVN